MRSIGSSTVVGAGIWAMCVLSAPSCGSSDAAGGASAGSGSSAGSVGSSGSAGSAEGSGGSSSGSGQGSPGVDVPTNGPGFPGAGAAGAGQPISAGLSPESCGGTPGDAGMSFQVKGPDVAECYFINSDQTHPAAIVEHVVETAENSDYVHIRLTLNPAFVDNTYGSTAIGWGGSDSGASMNMPMTNPPGMDAGGPGGPGMMMGGGMAPKPMPGGKGGHTFNDLVGSDHAEFVLTDANGTVVLDFNLDYISVDPSQPSGYGSLGVSGGDGKIIAGNASDIVAASSSLDRNFNACGYGSYTSDSPATDSSYTPNSSAPNWDYRVVYDVWIKSSAFGSAGFGDASIAYIHASPSKTSDTLPVTPGTCPPTGCPVGMSEGCPLNPGDDAGAPTCGNAGAVCSTNADCCNGYCASGVCGRPTCSALGDSCTKNSDCCADTAVCTSGKCANFVSVH